MVQKDRGNEYASYSSAVSSYVPPDSQPRSSSPQPANPFRFPSRRSRTLSRKAKNNPVVRYINYSLYFCAFFAMIMVFYKFEGSHWGNGNKGKTTSSMSKNDNNNVKEGGHLSTAASNLNEKKKYKKIN